MIQVNWPFAMVLALPIVFVAFIMWWLDFLGPYLVTLGLLTVGTLIGVGVAWVGRKLGIRIND